MRMKIVIFISFALQMVSASNGVCDTLLRELADKESHFVYCATKRAVPVTICTLCKNEHEAVNLAFDKLKGIETCASMYFDKDRVNLVAAVGAALNSLWSKAYCDSCNSNNTAEFKQMRSDWDSCINRTSPTDVCKECLKDYLTLNSYYTSLDVHNNGKVCFDIQDGYSTTLKMFSATYSASLQGVATVVCF